MGEKFETDFEEGDTIKLKKRNINNTDYEDWDKAEENLSEIGDIGVYTVKRTIQSIEDRGFGKGWKDVRMILEEIVDDVDNIDLSELVGEEIKFYLVQPEKRRRQEETGFYKFGVVEKVD